MRVDEISYWEGFITVARHANFTKAASTLGITPSQLSKRVAKLEELVGVRLFHRSTRVVTLTDEGRSLAPRVEGILRDLESLESGLTRKEGPSGRVRVTCVPFVAQKLLRPVLKKFLANNPNIHIELEISKNYNNLIETGFDMAIRVESPKDSDLIYRKLAPNQLVLCAAPAYLQERGSIEEIADLSRHNLLMLSIHHRCEFTDTPVQLGEFSSRKRLTCENGALLTDMALDGAGVLVRSIWDVQEHLQKGRLVQVLPQFPLKTFGNIYAVIPSKKYLAPRVRIFFDFVLAHAAEWTIEGEYSSATAPLTASAARE